jgi:hypothetical protein
VLRPLALAVVCCSSVALAEARSADLDKASRQIVDQKYEAAVRTLEVAARQNGNRHDTVLRILELQGVAYAQQGQEAKAKAAFQQLLSLDPKRELSSKYKEHAKAQKAFDAAQAWLADNPPMEVAAEPAAVDGTGKVMQIAVKVKNDSLKLARKVRFNVRPDGLKWSELEVDIQGSYAAAGTDAESVDWYAEVLGERDAVLIVVGSQRFPIREGKGAPPPAKKEEPRKVAEEPKRKLEPEPEPERPPEMVVKEPEPSGGGSPALRGIGYTALGLGVASLLGGTIMGLEYQVTLGEVTRRSMMRNTVGAINGITQDQAFGMEKRAILQAQIANTLWAAGGGLLLVGSLLWFLGRDVFVAPAGSGVTVSGRF